MYSFISSFLLIVIFIGQTLGKKWKTDIPPHHFWAWIQFFIWVPLCYSDRCCKKSAQINNKSVTFFINYWTTVISFFSPFLMVCSTHVDSEWDCFLNYELVSVYSFTCIPKCNVLQGTAWNCQLGHKNVTIVIEQKLIRIHESEQWKADVFLNVKFLIGKVHW